MDAVGPPKPKVLFEAEPFIPYRREAEFDPRLKPLVEDCRSQVGFLPNAYKLYAWRPEIAEALWRLERDIMGDPSSTLDRFLKRKLAVVACAVNGCAYSAAHSCAVLKKPVVDGVESWGMSEQELQDVIIGDQVPASEVERVCFDYIRAASQDPPAVTDEIRERMKQHLAAPQIVELACVVGFWKLCSTVHQSLHVPVESPLLGDTGYVDL